MKVSFEDLMHHVPGMSRRDLMKYASASAATAAGLGILQGSAFAQDAEPTPGGVWSVTLAGNPTAYPITAPGGINDVLVNKTLYNCLTQYILVDGGIQVVGDLAESWEASDDLSQYTFTLREGITWHDGTPLTSADVVFTIESMLNPDVTASQRGNIASIQSAEAVDDLTVTFTLVAPFAYLPVMLGYNIGIVPKHLLESADLNEPTDFLLNPVGSGPFKFKNLAAGDNLEVERYDDYFEGPALLDTIIFKIVPDGNSRVTQVQSGDVDLTIVEAPQVESFNGLANVSIREVPQVQYYMFGINHTSPVMQDVRVRQALAQVLDRQAIVDNLLGGFGAVATGPINPLLAEYYNPDVTVWAYDPDAAAALLDEAGWVLDGDVRKNEAGESLTIVMNGPQGYPVLEQVLLYAQQQFQQLGVDLVFEFDEWTVHLDKYRSQQYDLLLNWWITPPTPDLYAHYHSASDANWWKYNNPEVDELILAGRSEADDATRSETYHELQRVLADDVPVLYLWYGRELQALSNRTQGLPAMGYRDALTWSELIWVTE
ncbi:MAG: twin-arginine translocation signal domain-containing protein [Thermomicrobiales bacterium]|nr:twin-arginine translocation signal domain-containing protein [Thermomicrobiales bacterium]